MRLFFGIFLPPTVHARAVEASARARSAITDRSVRWVAAPQLHVTLQFLGELSEERASRAEEIAREIARGHAPFRLRLRGLGAFPNARRPSVLWLGVGDGDALHALAESLGAALATDGFSIEARAYHAHVTLARIKGPVGGRQVAALLAAEHPEAETDPFDVDAFALIESRPGPRGSEYVPRAQVSLTPARGR
ncbi:MAG: RNA 2',3'-cyclic phosphodiesterase [Deltaproteobacteria bacterium]|nr:RNA 2',3'-cyclic phosphodiesterase [Deltaproteobacteria bacterium]